MEKVIESRYIGHFLIMGQIININLTLSLWIYGIIGKIIDIENLRKIAVIRKFDLSPTPICSFIYSFERISQTSQYKYKKDGISYGFVKLLWKLVSPRFHLELLPIWRVVKAKIEFSVSFSSPLEPRAGSTNEIEIQTATANNKWVGFGWKSKQ